jgi:hypothetical protein
MADALVAERCYRSALSAATVRPCLLSGRRRSRLLRGLVSAVAARWTFGCRRGRVSRARCHGRLRIEYAEGPQSKHRRGENGNHDTYGSRRCLIVARSIDGRSHYRFLLLEDGASQHENALVVQWASLVLGPSTIESMLTLVPTRPAGLAHNSSAGRKVGPPVARSPTARRAASYPAVHVSAPRPRGARSPRPRGCRSRAYPVYERPVRAV